MKLSDFVYLRDSVLLENTVVNFTGPTVVLLKEKTIKYVCGQLNCQESLQGTLY